MDCHLDLVSERSNPLLKEIKEELHQLTDKYYFMLQILQGSDWALEDEEDREGEEHQAGEDPQHPISSVEEERSIVQSLFAFERM